MEIWQAFCLAPGCSIVCSIASLYAYFFSVVPAFFCIFLSFKAVVPVMPCSWIVKEVSSWPFIYAPAFTMQPCSSLPCYGIVSIVLICLCSLAVNACALCIIALCLAYLLC